MADPEKWWRAKLELLSTVTMLAFLCGVVNQVAEGKSGSAEASLITDSDLASLLAIKRALMDPNGVLAKWDSNDVAGACGGTWTGVRCANGQVVALHLPSKRLGGNLAPEIGQLVGLRQLSLHTNAIAGTIPSSISALRNLRGLYLFRNLLTGAVPPSLSLVLQALDLSQNSLTGLIPASAAASATLLRRLDLSSNNLSGAIPATLASLTRLEYLNLSRNMLSGAIPAGVGRLVALGSLDLSRNRLGGAIPEELGDATHLSTLDLSRNNLSGGLPASLSHLANLTYFNCSYNRLTGRVPGLARRFDASAFVGNPGLCGYGPAFPCSASLLSPGPAPTSGPVTKTPARASPSSSSPKKRFSVLSLVFLIIGIVIVVFLVLCVCSLLFLFCCRKSEAGFPGDKSTGLQAGPGKEKEAAAGGVGGGGGDIGGKLVHFEGSLGFAADDLLSATAEVLGKSTYGTVYKATLQDGNQVAVKRLREGIVKSQRDFEVEVTALGRIRHPNLLALRAYYWGPKDEKLLIFDFMPGGSLAAFLHARGPEAPLTWQTRMTIAIGTARGLAHLHDQESIIHGNLTSSNILLDSHLNPKLSDFGLSRLMTTAANSNVIATAGALGYRAPELTKLRKATPKTDVYSFGIVLLELLTGKAPGEGTSGENGMDLPDWVASIVKEEWTHEVFDLEIMRGRAPGDDELINTLQLAMTCVKIPALERPEMGEVVHQLEQIMPELKQ